MIIAMAGLPGAGKSTIAEIVGARLQAAVVSVDPIEAAILQAGIDSDEPTGLAAYLVAETIAGSIAMTGKSVIIDAVNAVNPAREQWVTLSQRSGEPLRFIEVVCSDEELHRSRLDSRERPAQYSAESASHAVEQSLDEYAEWTGSSAAIARITLDSVEPIGVNVDRAIAFLTA